MRLKHHKEKKQSPIILSTFSIDSFVYYFILDKNWTVFATAFFNFIITITSPDIYIIKSIRNNKEKWERQKMSINDPSRKFFKGEEIN